MIRNFSGIQFDGKLGKNTKNSCLYHKTEVKNVTRREFIQKNTYVKALCMRKEVLKVKFRENSNWIHYHGIEPFMIKRIKDFISRLLTCVLHPKVAHVSYHSIA